MRDGKAAAAEMRRQISSFVGSALRGAFDCRETERVADPTIPGADGLEVSQRFEGERLHDLRKGDVYRDFTVFFAKGAFVTRSTLAALG
jgi:hypothetical protein